MRAKISIVFLFIFFITMLTSGKILALDTINIDSNKVEIKGNPADLQNEYADELLNAKYSEHNKEEHDDSGHTSMAPLFFVILSLFIGAAVRHFLKNIPLPYTVILLVIGLILGLLVRFGLFGDTTEIADAVHWAGNIDPHLILFVFLPILIFEAAFAMDVHVFKKTAINSFLMAVPGIIIALILTAVLMLGMKSMGLPLSGWNLSIALMFGAVVSATDPVAVVALLKDLGASKKLGTLIEGESLLNDGTAIVIFIVFFNIIAPGDIINAQTDLDIGLAILKFLKVALGGIAIGLLIGYTVIAWVKRVFNDALVEISIIIAAAYITFFIAEGFFHVSGVLALVAYGLLMAGIGRTKISPGVTHFLHEFWEMAAFIANTLIFVIVGVVITQRVEFSGEDFLILGLLYIGIHIIRALSITLLFPLMRKTGYGLDKKNATVLWYGALRGAIGLALALVVAGISYDNLNPTFKDMYTPAEFETIKNQFLFYAAGIVTLTLLINATTIKFIVNGLGLTKVAPAKLLMNYNVKKYLKTSSENAIKRMKTERFLSYADWSEVDEYIPQESDDSILKENIETDNLAEIRIRILEKEKSSYWHQFKEGLLSDLAVQTLSDTMDVIIDEGGKIPLSERDDVENMLTIPKYLTALQNIPFASSLTRKIFFNKLSISYDCALALINSQDEALKLIASMVRGLKNTDKKQEDNIDLVESEIKKNRIVGLSFIRILRKDYPEIYAALATRQATRSVLNHELKTVDRLQSNGRINSSERTKMVDNIEERMKKLSMSPLKIKVPKPTELLSEVKWMKTMDEETQRLILDFSHSKFFAINEKILKPGQRDGIFIVVRGSASVSINNIVVAIVGHGDILGEVSMLTGSTSNALITVVSPVTAIWISTSDLKYIISKSKLFENHLWSFVGRRSAENIFRDKEPYSIWTKKKFGKWCKSGEIICGKDNTSLEINKNQVGILIYGKALKKGTEISFEPHSELQPDFYTLKEKSVAFIFNVDC